MQKQQPDSPESLHQEEQPLQPTSRRRFLRNAALGAVGSGAALAAGCEYKSQLFLLSRPKTEAEESKLPGTRVNHSSLPRSFGASHTTRTLSLS
jgi:hypothetical protein